jgi:hypothetical protein
VIPDEETDVSFANFGFGDDSKRLYPAPGDPGFPPKQKHPRPKWSRALRKNGARDRARTGDPQLGKLMLYQLSYSRAAAETRARAGSLPIVSSHSIR